MVLGEIEYPELAVLAQPHNVKLSPDGKTVIGTMPLTAADISNLDEPSTWEVRYFQCEVAQQVHPVYAPSADPVNLCSFVRPEQYVHVLVFPPPQLAHEPEFNPSGTWLYIGGQRQMDFGTDLPMHPRDEYVRVLDMTVWPPKVLGETFGPGHGINFATIGGREYLLNSDEAGSPGSECKSPPYLSISDSNAEVYLTDISDETAPRQVSTLSLAINTPEPEFCAAQEDSNEGPTCSTGVPRALLCSQPAARPTLRAAALQRPLPHGRRPERHDVRDVVDDIGGPTVLKCPRPAEPDRGGVLQPCPDPSPRRFDVA